MLMVTTAEENRHAFDSTVNTASARERVHGGASRGRSEPTELEAIQIYDPGACVTSWLVILRGDGGQDNVVQRRTPRLSGGQGGGRLHPFALHKYIIK